MPLSVRGRILPMCSSSPLRRIFAKLTLSTVGHLSCGPGSGVLAHSPGRLHRPFIISYMFTYVNKTVRLFTRGNCRRKGLQSAEFEGIGTMDGDRTSR